MKKYWMLMLFWPSWLFAQEEPSKLQANGYVKDMVTTNFTSGDSALLDNLIHHRLNLTYYINEHWTAKLEIRNRLFTGDLVGAIPNYSELIDVNNDYFNWSWTPIDERRTVLHTMIDRANVQWSKDDWEVTVGRQRLNWGKNLAWNPNDLFNSYSFFDFDYEERPGSDALRIKKYTGFASEIEFAIKAADRFEELTTALRYQVNYKNYDIQFIGGLMQNNLALGTGWAGSIGGMGLKGEATYLYGLDSLDNGFLASISLDYLFKNSLYLNGSALYSSYGSSNAKFLLLNSSSNLDIRSISPYDWSSFVQMSYPVHPLLNAYLATIYFPSDGSVFLNPGLTYSIMENLDLDLIGQMFFSESQDGTAIYLRLKYSY